MTRRRLAVSALVLFAALWLATRAGTMLVVEREVESVDAVLSLGSHEWERLPVAARLALEHGDVPVLLTEPRRLNPYNCHLCGERRGWLRALGIPPERIVVLPRRVTNTYDEAVAARQYCDAHSIRTLLIVTSPYHARRTLSTFSAVFDGADTVIGVHPAVESSPARPGRWWSRPYDRAYVGYELAALVWYGVRHGISPFVKG